MDGGAHYVKADLQVHTPRDPGWKGAITGDEDRRQFSREFVAACRAAGLGAVAITDHHDFGFVPYIREAAEQEIGTDGNPVDPERVRRFVDAARRGQESGVGGQESMRGCLP